MNVEAPRFQTVEYDVPTPIWTVDEIKQAIDKSKDLMLNDYKRLIEKVFQVGGQKIACALCYSDPVNIHWIFAHVPFPDKTVLAYSLRSSEDPKVLRAPFEFIVGYPDGEDESSEIDVSFKLNMSGMKSLEGRYRNIGTDHDDYILVDGEEKSFLYLPDDPELLSTLTITFVKMTPEENGTSNS